MSKGSITPWFCCIHHSVHASRKCDQLLKLVLLVAKKRVLQKSWAIATKQSCGLTRTSPSCWSPNGHSC